MHNVGWLSLIGMDPTIKRQHFQMQPFPYSTVAHKIFPINAKISAIMIEIYI